MAYEQRDNSGSLFKNDRKEQDKHPDYKGTAMIDGVEYWVSAWIKRPNGKPVFMSLSFNPKEDRPPPRQQQPPQETYAGGDDPVPF